MPIRQACERLIAAGYRRNDDGVSDRDCENFSPDEGDIDFLGIGASEPPAEDGSELSPRSVRFFSFTFEPNDDQPVVVSISVHTREPDRFDALIQATIEQWGQPTVLERHGYATLVYGASADQANTDNRADFSACSFDATCSFQRGVDCTSILPRYANVIAKVAVYGWGRSIQISDHGVELERLRASGALARRDWERPEAICQPRSIH